MKTTEERLQHYSLPIDGHLVWCGTSNPLGYGRMWVNGRTVLTHCLAWEVAYGPVPEGIHVLHLCDTPPCNEPEHLYLGTQADNMQDRDAAGNNHHVNKTRCPRGHPYDEVNTYTDPSGARRCRACAQDRLRYWRAKGTRKVVEKCVDK